MIDLSVSDLVKSFQIGENVLNGVTFHINEGERVGIGQERLRQNHSV